MRCDLKTERECGCPAGQCVAQPKPLPAHVSFSWRDYTAAIAFGIVVAIIFAGTLHMMRQEEIQLAQKARI